MRDYKHVKVPRSFGSSGRSKRSAVKRVNVGPAAPKRSASGASLAGMLLKAVAVLVLVAASFLGWEAYQVLMHSDTFVVAGVDITGVKQVKEGELREIAASFKGQSIFRVDIESAVRRVRANPWVKEARIHRSLPNRITMAITERAPACYLEAGGQRFLADDEGVVIERAGRESAPVWQLPTIALRELRAWPGAPADGIGEAQQLLAEIAQRGGWKLADVTVRAFTPESLAVLYADHEFRIGSGRFTEKLRRLAEIMADVKERNIEIAYVDLRPERQAAVMVKKTQFKVQSSK